MGIEPPPQCKHWITSPTRYPHATAPDCLDLKWIDWSQHCLLTRYEYFIHWWLLKNQWSENHNYLDLLPDLVDNYFTHELECIMFHLSYHCVKICYGYDKVIDVLVHYLFFNGSSVWIFLSFLNILIFSFKSIWSLSIWGVVETNLNIDKGWWASYHL